MNTGNISNLIIKKFWLFETDKVQTNVFRRTFDIDGSVGALNRLADVMVNSGVNEYSGLSAATLANNAPDMVRLSSTPTGIVKVPNGWGTRRLRFIMEVEAVSPDITTISYVQGFSEYHDPTISGRIDDKMEFYINSITEVNKFLDPITGAFKITPSRTYNVVNNIIGEPEYQEEINLGASDLKFIRTEDILGDLQTLESAAAWGGDSLDTEVKLVSGAVTEGSTVDKKEASGINYLTKTLNNFIESASMSQNSFDSKQVLRDAKDKSAAKNIMKNPFIFMLHAATKSLTVTSFTMEQLTSIAPNLPSVTHLFGGSNLSTTGIGTSVLDTNNVMDNMQPDVTTIIANTIAHSISSIMLDNLLMLFSVSFTNATGEPVVTVTDAGSIIDGLNAIPYANKAKIAIANILMPEVTRLNTRLIDVIIGSEIYTETTISISINGEPPKVYRYPTYADGLYTPTLANDAIKQTTANNVSNMIDEIYRITGSSENQDPENMEQIQNRWGV